MARCRLALILVGLTGIYTGQVSPVWGSQSGVASHICSMIISLVGENPRLIEIIEMSAGFRSWLGHQISEQ